MAATAGIRALTLRSFRNKRPQWSEAVPNRGLRNGAKVAAVETVDVEGGDDPYGSWCHSIGAIGPRVERTLQVVPESPSTVWKHLAIDSNSIYAHLELIARKRHSGFEQRCSAIGTAPGGPIMPAKGNGRRRSIGTKLDEVCSGSIADDVKPSRERRGKVKANAQNPACNEAQKKRGSQEASPRNSP